MSKRVIAIDIGGSHLQSAVFEPTEATPRKIDAMGAVSFDCGKITSWQLRQYLGDHLKYLMRDFPSIGGIGISVPAKLLPDGRIESKRFPALTQFDETLEKFIESVAQVPCWAIIDSAAAARAEAEFGAGKGYKRVAYFTLGSGVGGATVKKGVVQSRSFGFIVVPGGQFGPDLLENVANAAWIRRNAPAPHYDAKSCAESARRGDLGATATFVTLGNNLGCAVASVVNVWCPDVVVFGGGISQASDLFLPTVREQVAKFKVPVDSVKMPLLTPARFGSESSLIGAAAMALS